MQILLDFADAFKDVNTNILVDSWPTIRNDLKQILQQQYKSEAFHTEWPEEINDFLILLKLLPLKNVGKNVLASKDTFVNSVKKLIKFYDVRI